MVTDHSFRVHKLTPSNPGYNSVVHKLKTETSCYVYECLVLYLG